MNNYNEIYQARPFIKEREKMNITTLDQFAAETYLCKRLALTAGNLVLLCGTGSSGKTYLAQYIACCMSAGVPLFGKFKTKKSKVVHFDHEMSATQTKKRYCRIGSGLQVENLEVDRISITFRIDDFSQFTEKEVEENLIK